MTIQLSDAGTIRLTAICPSDEAEVLVQLLLAHPQAAVDWRGCDGIHTAVLQVLMAANRPLRGPPAAPFLRRWVTQSLHDVSS